MTTKFLAVAVLTALMLGSCASAGGKTSLPNVKITEYGIYQLNLVGTVENPDAPKSTVLQSDTFKLVERTTAIRMAKGLSFGISYLLDEPGTRELEIVRKIIHPEYFDPYSNRKLSEYVSKRTLKAGEPDHQAYQLTEDFEMVLGKWSFQLWYGDHMLAQQSFYLTK